MRSLEWSTPQKKKAGWGRRERGLRGLWEAEVGVGVSWGQLPFGKTAEFWRRMQVTVAQQGDCTQRHRTAHSEMVKIVHFVFCVFYRTNNNNNNDRSSGFKTHADFS